MLRGIKLPLLPLHEQSAIVERFDAAMSACERVKGEAYRSQVRLSSLRRSILAAAFSGQLVPQDPDDEPASVLLERIRAERAAAAPTKRTRKAKAS
jgi:type I restriction enzyme S subunit